jgi:hypothetical protein
MMPATVDPVSMSSTIGDSDKDLIQVISGNHRHRLHPTKVRFTPKADVDKRESHVRFVPQADERHCSKNAINLMRHSITAVTSDI